MKLYHGTSAAHKDDILKNGIQPRGKKRGNWKGAPSRNDGVYLTDSYAPYFAMGCRKKKEDGLIVEIDTDRLEQFLLAPDEDVLEQLGRNRDKIKDIPDEDEHQRMLRRTAWYRKRLENWAGNDAWELSLKAMGTCCYLRNIPPNAITRMATIPGDATWLFMSWDASITLMNYRILGNKYKLQTHRLFGDPVLELDGLTQDDFKIEIPGVTVDTIKDGHVIDTKVVNLPDERVRLKKMMSEFKGEQDAATQDAA